ncbi:MAG: hypothetical protein NTV23_10560 [Propionibacteriales bacterium]|nr:hypothetical protein [Propionibacteriales bacterium]
MKKHAIAAVGVFAAVVAVLVGSNPAQAYPNVQASLSAPEQVLASGQQFTVVASSSAECAWDLSWDGAHREVRGTQFQTTFVAPTVTRATELALSGVCRYADPSGTGTSADSSSVTPDDLVFTVRPAGTATTAGTAAASLAGTGGPDRLVLVGGVGLLLAGAVVAVAARRRAEQAELTAQTV